MTKEKVKFSNMALDLNTMQKTDDEGIHIVMYYEYDPKADCPKFKAFLKQVLPDEESRIAVQKFFGAMFFDGARRRTQKLLELIGSGANGKSVLVNVMESVLRNDYVSAFSPSDFTTSKYSDQNANLANGRLMNVVYDISRNSSQSCALKKYVSGETIIGRGMYEDSFIASELPLFVMMTNQSYSKPALEPRRRLCINFPVTIDRAHMNPKLVSELCMEKAGIFNWIMEGRNG